MPEFCNCPLVSIGVPVYNGAATLNQALLSLRNQTYKNLEIIISDDCSSDSSSEVIWAHAERDQRVKVFHARENLGAVDNFNLVVKKASGDYFFWHAQDDIRHPLYVEKCVLSLLSDPRLVFCHSKYGEFLTTTKNLLHVRSIAPLSRLNPSARFIEAYRSRIGSTAFYGIFNLRKVRELLVWENYNGADINIFLSVLLKGPVAEVSDVLFYYRAKERVRDKWTHFKFMRRSNNLPIIYLPGFILFLRTIRVVIRSRTYPLSKLFMLSSMLWIEVSGLFVRFIYRLLVLLFGNSVGGAFLRKLNRTDIQQMDTGFYD